MVLFILTAYIFSAFVYLHIPHFYLQENRYIFKREEKQAQSKLAVTIKNKKIKMFVLCEKKVKHDI